MNENGQRIDRSERCEYYAEALLSDKGWYCNYPKSCALKIYEDIPRCCGDGNTKGPVLDDKIDLPVSCKSFSNTRNLIAFNDGIKHVKE